MKCPGCEKCGDFLTCNFLFECENAEYCKKNKSLCDMCSYPPCWIMPTSIKDLKFRRNGDIILIKEK